jgi:hypothetical protein
VRDLDFKVAPSQHITMRFPKQILSCFLTLSRTSQAASRSHIVLTFAALAGLSKKNHHGGPEQEFSRPLSHRRFEKV